MDFRFPLRSHNGDTNDTLLLMEWLSCGSCIEFCRVSPSGTVGSARYVINWATQGGYRTQLDTTNLGSLTATMDMLPPPANKTLPNERSLVIRGMLTNQWFEYTYDRADVPKEVERLYEITGAPLIWFIPQVKEHAITNQSCFGGDYLVARDAPVGVSMTGKGIQVWDLSRDQISMFHRCV
jgi:hypothetical protein